MNAELLQRWVDDDLSSAELRAVYRWMVTCTDPDLPTLLHGMLRERRETVADQRLRAHPGLWAAVVARWHTLLEAGEASWSSLGAVPVLASVDVDEEPAGAWLDEAPEGGVVLVLDTSQPASVLITTDTPTVRQLCDNLPAGTHRLPLPTLGPRPTVWVFLGATLPQGSSPAQTLQALMSDPAVVAQALRWRD